MEGMQGLGTGLAALVHALDRRKVALLDEVRRVEQDLEAARRTVDTAERMGLGNAAPQPSASGTDTEFPVRTSSATRVSIDARSAPPSARRQDVPRVADVIPMTGRTVPVSPARDFEVHRAALSTLGSVRKDKDIPPKIDASGRRVETIGMPTSGVELAAIKESLKGIAEKVAKQPPGPGERRYKSVRGLVPGEAMAPTLRKILKIADRALTSNEIAVAFMQVRGVRLEGDDLTGLTNRVSSFLGQEAGRKLITGHDQEGTRQKLWTWVGGDIREPSLPA